MASPVDFSKYQLYHDNTGLMRGLAGGLIERQKQNQLAEKEAATLERENNLRKMKGYSTHAYQLFGEENPELKRKGIAILGQQIQQNGGDVSKINAMLELENPDELNTHLLNFAIHTDPDTYAEAAGKRSGSSVQFGSTQTYADDDGNYYSGTRVDNPATAQSKYSITPVGDAPLEPKGKLSLVTSAGMSPEATIQYEADRAGAVTGSQQQQKLNYAGLITAAQSKAAAAAKAEGEAFTEYHQTKAALPQMKEVVTKLRELSEVATYTWGGRLWNEAVKQSGFGSTDGADARAKYQATIDNEVLPLLKLTFGAAFTAAEGDALRATLGDVNASPSEKQAALDAFIAAQERKIKTREATAASLSNARQPPSPQNPSAALSPEEQAELEQLRSEQSK